MPRYIDADKFVAELEQEKTVALEFEDGVAVYEIEHTMNLIGMQPTADVVPKSEVDEWQKLFADSQKKWEEAYSKLEQDNEDLRNVLADTINKYRNCETEVAREIFEEIEGSIAVHAFTSKSEDYADGMYDAIEWVDSKIAELKKKYTEGNNEES